MAKHLDLVWDQGSRYQLLVQPVVAWLTTLAGYSARGMVRTSRTLPNASILLDISSYLTVNVPDGTVLLDLPANITAAQTWYTGEYDLELFDGNVAHDVRFLQGRVKLDKESTK